MSAAGNGCWRCGSVLSKKGRVRRRDHPELMALLQALYQYGEPCWWCDRPATEPAVVGHFLEAMPLCQRCGLDLLSRDGE